MSQSRLAAAVLLYSVTLWSIGCASAPNRGNASDEPKRDETLEQARESSAPDAREYQAMDGQYRERAFDAVIQRARAFIKMYPASQYLAHVYNLRGLAHIALKQYPFALFQLKKAVELAKNGALRNMAGYNLAYVHFELGQLAQAGQGLDAIKPFELERPDRFKYSVLHAKIARARQDYVTATEDTLSALQFMPEPNGPATLEPMLAFLDEALEPLSNMSSVTALERVLGEHEGSPGADRLIYKIAGFYYGSGEREKARKLYERLVSEYPESRYYAAARERVRRVESQGVVEPRRIGVVLTLSGKFGKFGAKALQGIELALGVFRGPADPDSIEAVVLDDQGDVDRALWAIDELVYRHHVAAIIGPLVSKLADPMGKRAQELGVPLVALTQKEASGGDFVFNAALTPAAQARELIRYATSTRHASRFAILSPSGKFGEEYAKAFWDEIDQTSGVVRGYETYPNDETDFRTYVDRLVGLSQPDARAHELEELRLLKAATPVKSRSKKFDRMFDLKPIVDFEAVFIPDEPKALGQILPTFAYRDVEKVLFLGINTWNSQELVARAGQFAEGSIFVDGFHAGSQTPSSRKFIEEFRGVFSSDPGLVEALAYDAGRVLVSLAAGGDVRARSELRDRIMSLKDFSGVTGKISYQSGRLTKRLCLLTVKGGKIEEIAFQ